MRPLLLVLLSILASQSMAQQTVYRWTDENGQVHYGARPHGDDAEEVRMRSDQPSVDTARHGQSRAEMRQKLLQSYERDRQLKRQAEEKRKAEQRKRDSRCKELQRHWRDLNYPGPVYYKDGQGERKYLSEDERQAEKGDLAREMKRTCGKAPQ